MPDSTLPPPAVTADRLKFADLGRPRRVWAIGAVQGDVHRLAALHDDVGQRFQPGDRLVYLGNYGGPTPYIRATMDELLAFRRAVLAIRGVLATDLVYLRGAQEEMWQKLLQLQFATSPIEVLNWLLTQGLDAAIRAYGADPAQGRSAAREGPVAITRWTSGLRAAQKECPGHDALFTVLRRAAFTSRAVARPLLFVNAGLDPARPLNEQADAFWWGAAGFARIGASYDGFARVVRGYDPGRGGVQIAEATVTLDAGCGQGGPLAAGCFDATGELIELIEA